MCDKCDFVDLIIRIIIITGTSKYLKNEVHESTTCKVCMKYCKLNKK